jgi:hypothetical protein
VSKQKIKIQKLEEPGSMLKLGSEVLFKREELHNTGSNPMMCR